MKTLVTTLGLLTISALFLTGCVRRYETIYQDVPRAKVEFENEKAARMFYEALSKAPEANHRENKVEFHIPVVLRVTKTEQPSPNLAFNDAVSRADTNQDGKITELEATIFAGQH